MKASLKPVLINSTDQGYDVPLVEAQLTIVLWLKVIQGFTAGLSCRKKTVERCEEGERKNSHSLKIVSVIPL